VKVIKTGDIKYLLKISLCFNFEDRELFLKKAYVARNLHARSEED